MESTPEPTDLSTLDYEYLDYDERYLLWKRLNMFSIVAFSLIFVLGTIGNGLVIFITGFRMKKTVHTIWILNLAIADFTFTFFLIFNIVHISLDFHWPFGYIMCKLSSAIIFFNLFASIFLLVVISVDRCISVWFPVWCRNRRTPRLASFVVLGVWILALVLCYPKLYFRDSYYDDDTNKTYCFSSYGMIDEGGQRTHYAMVISQFIFGFIIPFSVIAVCYGAIIVRLRRDKLSKSRKPFKVITAVIVAFLVCWFPFHLVSFLQLVRQPQGALAVLLVVGLPLSTNLAYFNSCLNPILYFFLGHNFREKQRRPLLSALANAFTEEEGNQHTTKTTPKPSAELETHDL